MIKESTYYDIICDRCGKSFNDESNTCCYPDIESVKMTAIHSEWRAIGGKHYCPNCYEIDEVTYKYKPKKAYKMKQTIEIEVPEGKKAVWKDGKVVFEDLEPKLPKTWEEFCKNNSVSDKEACIEYDGNINTIQHSRLRGSMVDKNTLPSYEAAEQHLVLMQLHQLRDCYRQGWVPDDTSTSNKFCIVHYFDFYLNKYDYKINTYTSLPRFLSFKSKEIAEEFLDNFRDLIEQAGDLI